MFKLRTNRQMEKGKTTSPDYLIRALAVSLAYFVLAAALGVILRLAFVVDLPEWVDYRNVKHAHSHVALLGWLFGAFFILIIKVFSLDYTEYRVIYWLLQGSVAGMAITFPVVGYTPLSIAFTTAHIILSYIFVMRLWTDLNRNKTASRPTTFLKASLIYMAISTLGAWALGPIIALGMKGTPLYFGAIQFYLHFQFNGWLIFAMLAILLRLFEDRHLELDKSKTRALFILLTISTILTFALAITWSTPNTAMFAVNSVGVLIQLGAFGILGVLALRNTNKMKTLFSPFTQTTLMISIAALALKVLVQTAVVIPYIAEISYTIRNFIVGFIHLLMLGSLSLFLFSMITEVAGFKANKLATWIFITGVIITELLLFSQGIFFWAALGFITGYNEILALFSIVTFVGVFLWTFAFIHSKD